MLAEPIVSWIRYNNPSFFWVYSGIREVLDPGLLAYGVPKSSERATYSWITQRAFCNGLKQSRFSNICESNLALIVQHLQPREGVIPHTMPLFRLFPGRPSRIFFSSSFFLGGIFLRLLKYERKVNGSSKGRLKAEGRLAVPSTPVVVPAADRLNR